MTRFETLMLWTGLAVVIALAGFMLLAQALQPDPAGLALLVLGFLAAVALIAVVPQARNKNAAGPVGDEREMEIDRKAEQWAYRALEAGVFVTMGALLAGWLATPSETIVALILAVGAAGLVRSWGALWMAKRA